MSQETKERMQLLAEIIYLREQIENNKVEKLIKKLGENNEL